MRWICSNRKRRIYVCLKSEITSGSVETAWNRNITDICFFVFQAEAIAIPLNWGLDATDYKELQYLNDSQYNSKWLTIHYISAPFHMSILIFFQLPPWKGFAVHALCLQQPAEFHTFTNARDLSMYTVHFLWSIFLYKTRIWNLEAAGVCFYCTSCYRTSTMHGSHVCRRVSVHLKDPWREAIPVYLMEIHASHRFSLLEAKCHSVLEV